MMPELVSASADRPKLMLVVANALLRSPRSCMQFARSVSIMGNSGSRARTANSTVTESGITSWDLTQGILSYGIA